MKEREKKSVREAPWRKKKTLISPPPFEHAPTGIELFEKGQLPDVVARLGIRAMLKDRIEVCVYADEYVHDVCIYVCYVDLHAYV